MNKKIEIKKGNLQVSVEIETLDIITFKEGKYYVAFLPALNITSHSVDKNKAVSQAEIAVKMFFDYWMGKNKLDEKLASLGWIIAHKKKLKPSENSIHIPLSLLNKKYSSSQVQVPAYC